MWIQTFYHEMGHFLFWTDAERKADTFTRRMVRGLRRASAERPRRSTAQPSRRAASRRPAAGKRQASRVRSKPRDKAARRRRARPVRSE